MNMKMTTKKRSSFALICILSSVCFLVEARPKFPAPPDATIARIGNDFVVNGVPTDTRLFTSEESPEQILSFYRRLWPEGNEDNPGRAETDALAPWRILTRIEDGFILNVQVRPGEQLKGSAGYLSISRLPDNPERQKEPGAGFPKMRGSYVVSDIQSKDTAKRGRTILVMNRASVNSNANFYRDFYLNSGWSKEMDKTISGGNTHTLRFRDGSQNVSIVIHKGNRTSVAAQVVKEGLF